MRGRATGVVAFHGLARIDEKHLHLVPVLMLRGVDVVFGNKNTQARESQEEFAHTIPHSVVDPGEGSVVPRSSNAAQFAGAAVTRFESIASWARRRAIEGSLSTRRCW